MANIIASTIATTVFNKAMEAVTQPHVPVSDAAAETVATAVTEKVAPIVVNATNNEKWWQSRIYLGLIAAGLGALLSHFGYTVSGPDLELIVNNVGVIIEVAGGLYAAYGRIVGAKKKPLGAN